MLLPAPKPGLSRLGREPNLVASAFPSASIADEPGRGGSYIKHDLGKLLVHATP